MILLSYTALFKVLLLEGIYFIVCKSNMIAEYHFNGKLPNTQFFASINNSTTQGTFYTPVGMFGTSFLANEPKIVPMGALMEYNKWMYVTSDFQSNGVIGYYTFEIWFYYIQGNLGTFLNLDTTLFSFIGFAILETYTVGATVNIRYKAGDSTNTMGVLNTGWNNVLFGMTGTQVLYNK